MNTYKLEITTYANGKKSISQGSIDVDVKKIEELKSVCEYYKCSFKDLIELMLERITKEEAEELIASLDM